MVMDGGGDGDGLDGGDGSDDGNGDVCPCS